MVKSDSYGSGTEVFVSGSGAGIIGLNIGFIESATTTITPPSSVTSISDLYMNEDSLVMGSDSGVYYCILPCTGSGWYQVLNTTFASVGAGLVGILMSY
ncbi:hypothetical protein BDK51DRAFT_40354 [Blyttiomyces helicus]|uniref:Uncharacterized protein n=1 Tax=Blyttiomyces helicus TaxID=388810 RepID=A0A4P9WBF1_9FUNG|nr:hypothetical protein BDK51DRAFT_40354 [Blyttiomyces helicus]|eukprot:RKO88925.1 hypothetical protein BDK51DRAFT_40354 [Blyttiomyces helicus]